MTNENRQDLESITINKQMDNVTKYEDEIYKFDCDITGNPTPRYTWLKDEVVISKDKKRRKDKKDKITIKEEPWGSLLKIEKLDLQDNGKYTCLAENSAGKQTVDAYLHVIPAIKVQKSSQSGNGLKNLYKDTNVDAEGFCQTFQSTVCKTFLGGDNVFVTYNFQQGHSEEAISKMIERLDYNEECSGLLVQATCYYSFPVCLWNMGKISALKMCKEECEDITQLKCPKQFQDLKRSFPDEEYNHVIINCSALPSMKSPSLQYGQSCNSIHRSNLPITYSIEPNGNLPVTKEPSIIAKQNVVINHVNLCYTHLGSNYSGSIAHTKSHKACIPWLRVKGSKYVEKENYCRNPNPKEMSAPWCFVTEDGQSELCEISKCIEIVSPDVPMRKNLVPIFISSACLLVFVCLVFISCFLCRKSKDRSSPEKGYVGIASKYRFMTPKKVTEHHLVINDDQRLTLHSNLSFIMNSGVTSRKNCNNKIDAKKFPAHVNMNRIHLTIEIGNGLFGAVYKGEIHGLHNDTSCIIPVLIKTLHESQSQHKSLQAKFKDEASLMFNFRHRNVLPLLAVQMSCYPWCLIYEFLTYGDLHDFLLYHKPNQYSETSISDTSLYAGDEMGILVTIQDQLCITIQIAAGLDYLSNNNFIHKDIATRNILLGERLLCKISDFGSTRHVYKNDYHCLSSTSELIPIRWMPPEAIMYSKFSVQSDIWAFGVLLWEIWSYGTQPYSGFSNYEVIELICARQILSCPENCPVKVYALMQECWNQVLEHRPLFLEITRCLTKWLSHESHMYSKNQTTLSVVNGSLSLVGSKCPVTMLLNAPSSQSANNFTVPFSNDSFLAYNLPLYSSCNSSDGSSSLALSITGSTADNNN